MEVPLVERYLIFHILDSEEVNQNVSYYSIIRQT